MDIMDALEYDKKKVRLVTTYDKVLTGFMYCESDMDDDYNMAYSVRIENFEMPVEEIKEIELI